MPRLNQDQQKDVENAEAFGLLDEGIYEAVLEECTDKGPDGSPLRGEKGEYWKWTWAELVNVQDGTRAPGRQWYRTSMAFPWKLKEVYEALGLEVTQDGQEGLGRRVLLVINQSKITSGSRKGELSNNITQVLAIDSDLSEVGIPNPILSGGDAPPPF